MQKYFTKNTLIVNIDCDHLINYEEDKETELNDLAQKISAETHVPINCIYEGKYNCRISNWHQMNGEYYYFKPMENEDDFFNELLGELISQYFDLDTIHYQIAARSVKGSLDTYGILSKNFCEKQFHYHILSDYICANPQLSFFPPDLRILETIQAICSSQDEYTKLQTDFKKLIIRHFYNTQQDGGNAYNIMLKETNDGIRLAPLYDYAWAYIGSQEEDICKIMWDIGEFNITHQNTQDLLRNDAMFQELLHKVMDADVASLCDEVEHLHHIIVPSQHRERYQACESQVKRMIKKYKLIQ